MFEASEFPEKIILTCLIFLIGMFEFLISMEILCFLISK